MDDIRWKQRFSNFQKALKLLEEALYVQNPSNLEVEGMIQRFEYTFELAWKTLNDYLEAKGFAEIVGSRDCFRLAFANGIIKDGEAWMEMIIDRNQTTHLYEQHVVKRIEQDIRQRYYSCFADLQKYLEKQGL